MLKGGEDEEIRQGKRKHGEEKKMGSKRGR